jgi:hypothetical protein
LAFATVNVTRAYQGLVRIGAQVASSSDVATSSPVSTVSAIASGEIAAGAVAAAASVCIRIAGAVGGRCGARTARATTTTLNSIVVAIVAVFCFSALFTVEAFFPASRSLARGHLQTKRVEERYSANTFLYDARDDT